MRRVALIGDGGCGKCTLACALGRHLRISVHEVDGVHLRSPREMARWLSDVTTTTAGVAD